MNLLITNFGDKKTYFLSFRKVIDKYLFWSYNLTCFYVLYFSYNFTLSMANNNGKLLNIWLNILEKNMFLQIIK